MELGEEQHMWGQKPFVVSAAQSTHDDEIYFSAQVGNLLVVRFKDPKRGGLLGCLQRFLTPPGKESGYEIPLGSLNIGDDGLVDLYTFNPWWWNQKLGCSIEDLMRMQAEAITENPGFVRWWLSHGEFEGTPLPILELDPVVRIGAEVGVAFLPWEDPGLERFMEQANRSGLADALKKL